MKQAKRITRAEKKRKFKTIVRWEAEKRKKQAQELNANLNNPEHSQV